MGVDDEVDKSSVQLESVERTFIVSARQVKNETIPRLIRKRYNRTEYEVTVSSKLR